MKYYYLAQVWAKADYGQIYVSDIKRSLIKDLKREEGTLAAKAKKGINILDSPRW